MTEQPKKNIWVFGGAGFIGRALVDHLSKNPDNRINMLIHRTMPCTFLDRFNTVTGSIGMFDPFWFERYPPDVLFHLARPAGSCRLTRIWASRKGEQANRRLVSIMKNLDTPPVVVYVSGSLLYGPRADHDPASEDSPVAPASFAGYYQRNEKPWLEAQQEDALDVRFARPGWITGANSWFERFFWQHIMTKGKVPCYGNGNQLMSIIHLDDGVAMIDALSRKGKRGQNLNVFAGAPVSQKRFCEMLADITGKEIEFITEIQLEKQLGKTVAKALTTSIPMRTKYPEVQEAAGRRFADHRALLSDVVRLLKNKQSVFTPCP